jgi:phosphopantetheine--protein transferase-like protein
VPTQPRTTDPHIAPAPQGAPVASYVDLTSALGNPFGARVALARFNRPFQSAEEWLAAARGSLNAAEAEGLARVEGRSPARRQEWLLGRLAAKRALSELMNGSAAGLSVVSNAEGRPIVASANGAAPNVSITHKNGIAVAAASAGPVGVDIESLGALRDPDAFAERVLSADERAYALSTGDPDSAVVVFWSLKEAASKALLAPFVGQEALFSVQTINPSARRARVLYANRAADLTYIVRDGYVCAVAAES